MNGINWLFIGIWVICTAMLVRWSNADDKKIRDLQRRMSQLEKVSDEKEKDEYK